MTTTKSYRYIYVNTICKLRNQFCIRRILVYTSLHCQRFFIGVTRLHNSTISHALLKQPSATTDYSTLAASKAVCSVITFCLSLACTKSITSGGSRILLEGWLWEPSFLSPSLLSPPVHPIPSPPLPLCWWHTVTFLVRETCMSFSYKYLCQILIQVLVQVLVRNRACSICYTFLVREKTCTRKHDTRSHFLYETTRTSFSYEKWPCHQH